MSLPTGTVTFLFTDVEGSTRLWESHPEAMRLSLEQHDRLAQELIPGNGGHVVMARGEGDSLFCVFESASQAVRAALDLQIALTRHAWPENARLSVRMALHTGEAQFRDDDYYGSEVNRCARLRSIGHGGQTLLSESTAELARPTLREDAALRDLGMHRLKDLQRPERVFQVLHADLRTEYPPLNSLTSLPNNLPQQLTTFVGREKETAEVAGMLRGARLVTLVGSGGVGKTRLAIQVAAECVELQPDGVWLAELAPLSDPALVPQAIATELGVREEPGRDLSATLADYLRPKTALLLLDNCEHLIEASATFVDVALKAAPNLRVLATSREALNVPGEGTYRVPSLSLPQPGDESRIERLVQSESVRLFVDRAALTNPGFQLSGPNAPSVAHICLRLDGIPLAIELAAARVKSMSAEQIAARLDDAFRLLTGGSRTALPRQQTLRAAIEWSYNLLDEQEKLLLQRLSVFSGGWTLESAEKVCSDDAALQGAAR